MLAEGLSAKRGARSLRQSGGSMIAAVVFLLVLGTMPGPWGGVHVTHAAFLEDQLPLKLVITTPVELMQGGNGSLSPVTISGRQAITVVYSRPVIALGADFGNSDNFGGKVPFTLSCSKAPVPAGKFRWVTTTIARFDPDQDWPTDLDCTFTPNAALTAYDGTAVQLGGAGPRRLASEPLSMSLSNVISDRAMNLTGGLWSPTAGMPDDLLPEVPPDGIVTLTFNYPVNFPLLASKLHVSPSIGTNSLKLSKCITPLPWGDTATDAPVTGDAMCVAVSFSKTLKTGIRYRLVLPAGSVYSAYTGPTSKDVSVDFGGLRAFRIPIRQDFPTVSSPYDPIWDGTTYRRLTLWLPHGLSPKVTAAQLTACITICSFDKPYTNGSSCTPVPITSSKLMGLAQLQLSIAGLQPRQRYAINVKADDTITDGYGKPLQASSGAWWTLPIQPFVAAPVGQVAVFDTLPAAWPVLTLGTDNYTKQASVWSLDIKDEKAARQLIGLMAYPALVSDALGKPSQDVTLSNVASPIELYLNLDSSKDVHVTAQCCATTYYPTQKLVSINVQLVLRSQLVATWVVSQGMDAVVWVTSGDPSAPGPVQGATAYLYDTYVDTKQRAPVLLGSCVTDASGACAVGMPAPDPNRGLQLSGIVLSSRGLAFTAQVSQAGSWWTTNRGPYAGALALDRGLVRPGDTLHVTGYIAQKTNSSESGDGWPLGAPDVTSAMLKITPGWTKGKDSTTVTVPMTQGYGSIHTTCKVPATATVGSYYVNLYVLPPKKQTQGRRLAQAGEANQGAMGAVTGGSMGTGAFHGSMGFHGTGMMRRGAQALYEYQLVATDSIVVSDPRPPTADLTLTVPPWAPPAGKVKVSVQATSYLGNQVSQAPIQIVWSTAKAKGVKTVTTDSQGAASATINLGSLPARNSSSAGDVLSVEVSWVGPTRERITRTASVKLEASSRRVVLSRTLDTQVPLLPWGVAASVTSMVDDSTIQGVKLQVTLKPNTTAGASCTTTSSCTITSGSAASAAKCQLALPCMGAFILTACTTDEPKACSDLNLGFTAAEWALNPLNYFDDPTPSTNATEYTLGSVAGVTFQNPWGPSVSALIAWGNVDSRLRTQGVASVPLGSVTLPVTLGPECRGGCAVTVLLSVPRVPGAKAPAGVPVSKLFDVGGLHTHVLGPVSIKIDEPSQLDVSVSVNSGSTTSVNGSPLALVAPGGNATVTVKVAHAGKPASNAEVTLIAVDKAILDLVPYPLRDLAASLTLDLVAELAAQQADLHVAPGALDAVFSTLMRRLGLDPWLPVDTTILPPKHYPLGMWQRPAPSNGLAAVDYTDTAYLDLYTSALTYGLAQILGHHPHSGCGAHGGSIRCASRGHELNDSLAAAQNSLAAAVQPVGDASNKPETGGGSGSGSSSSPRIATKFISTPMFTIRKTTVQGVGTATFMAPMNLGTFIVRAYAVSTGVSALGSGEVSLVVRRLLSLTASTPRIVRTEDNFLAGVLVTSPGLSADAPPFTVTVQFKLIAAPGNAVSPIKLLSGSDSATVTLSGKANQAEVRFNLTAAALGTATLQFSATDGSGASDALQTPLPVLPQQSPVFIATSFSLRPTNASNGTSQWQEGLQLPDAVQGRGSLDLLVGVGHLPAIIASTDAIATQRATQYTTERTDLPLDASTALALAIVPPVLEQYNQSLTEAQKTNASDAFGALITLTDKELGLLPYPPGQYGWTPARADIILNARAFFLISSLSFSGAYTNKTWAAESPTRVPLWRIALARQLIKDATSSRNPPYQAGGKPQPYQDWYTLAWSRLALGGEWQPYTCGSLLVVTLGGVCTDDAKVIGDLSLEPLLAKASSPKAVLTVRLLTALALQNTSNVKYSDFISKTADLLLSSVRVTARTAYIAAYPGASGAAPLDTQALALRLLVALSRPQDAILLQKLAAYLAAPGGTGASMFGKSLPPQTQSPWVTALSATSLARYDAAAGSTQPHLSITAVVGKTVVLQAQFNQSTQGQPLPHSSTPWSKLPRPPGSLDFDVKGKGEVSVSVGLSFVPAKPLGFPTYRGIWVSAVIQAVDPITGDATGPALRQAPLASLLKVTLQITSPDDLGSVTVEALTAGGLEPLDPLTSAGSGTGADCPLLYWAGDAFSRFYWNWWWPICPAQEVRPSSVTWRWQALMAGTQTVTYTAVAATEGVFQLPPIKASADNQPEVMGMTASGTFIVGPAGSRALSLTPAPGPKSCPKDCNAAGACNTITGTCVCVTGWMGEACDLQEQNT